MTKTLAEALLAFQADAPPFDKEIVRLLGEPLDPTRVKRRQGRGAGSLSYLETHDVKRTLNRIFGFGNWGYEIVEQVEIGAIEVAHSRDASKKGWHVGYRCIVRLYVRGAVPISDVGYGDGVEYGPAARVTAQELASKESASDGLKRAAVALGDQFGLILYAKDEDAARIARDQAGTNGQAEGIEFDRYSHHPGGPEFGEVGTEPQRKKLRVLVSKLEKAGKITREQLERAVASDGRGSLGNLDVEGGMTLTKRQASGLIERLETLEKHGEAGTVA